MNRNRFIWLSIAACLISIIMGWARRRDDPLIQLALFALTAFAANAFFMSSLSGVFGRYQARIAFLVIFPGFALIARWFRKPNLS
jgi:hypothetical protein